MKKLLLAILIALSANAFAEDQTIVSYTAYQFSIRSANSDFTPWESCNIPITMNFTTQQIAIFSKQSQLYYIIDTVDSVDKNAFIMQCQDINGRRCLVRFWYDGTVNLLHLYIEYNDVTWGYLISAN